MKGKQLLTVPTISRSSHEAIVYTFNMNKGTVWEEFPLIYSSQQKVPCSLKLSGPCGRNVNNWGIFFIFPTLDCNFPYIFTQQYLESMHLQTWAKFWDEPFILPLS